MVLPEPLLAAAVSVARREQGDWAGSRARQAPVKHATSAWPAEAIKTSEPTTQGGMPISKAATQPGSMVLQELTAGSGAAGVGHCAPQFAGEPLTSLQANTTGGRMTSLAQKTPPARRQRSAVMATARHWATRTRQAVLPAASSGGKPAVGERETVAGAAHHELCHSALHAPEPEKWARRDG